MQNRDQRNYLFAKIAFCKNYHLQRLANWFKKRNSSLIKGWFGE